MGTVTYEFNMTFALVCMGNTDPKSVIDKEATRVLSNMPEGTKYLGHSVMPVTSLCVPYVMVFEHPAFQDGTKLETDWVRHCYTDGYYLKDVNIPTGVRYFNPDGTPKFHTVP
jgi:hypothetical protein